MLFYLENSSDQIVEKAHLLKNRNFAVPNTLSILAWFVKFYALRMQTNMKRRELMFSKHFSHLEWYNRFIGQLMAQYINNGFTKTKDEQI